MQGIVFRLGEGLISRRWQQVLLVLNLIILQEGRVPFVWTGSTAHQLYCAPIKSINTGRGENRPPSPFLHARQNSLALSHPPLNLPIVLSKRELTLFISDVNMRHDSSAHAEHKKALLKGN